jgi:adenosylcobinamide-GDP ribazoletransferase
VAAVVLAAAGVVGLAFRRIGGFTGDVLGAAGVVGQSAGLLVAAARW